VDRQANRVIRPLVIAWGIAFALLGSGCTSFREWWHNGFKVGPTDRCIKMVKFFQGEIWGKYVVFSEFSAAFAL